MGWASTWQNQQNDQCTQWRLRSAWASAESDQSSLSAWTLAFCWVHSEDSDAQTGPPRLIWVFAGCTSFCWFCRAAACIHFHQTLCSNIEGIDDLDLCHGWHYTVLGEAIIGLFLSSFNKVFKWCYLVMWFYFIHSDLMQISEEK